MVSFIPACKPVKSDVESGTQSEVPITNAISSFTDSEEIAVIDNALAKLTPQLVVRVRNYDACLADPTCGQSTTDRAKRDLQRLCDLTDQLIERRAECLAKSGD